MIPHNKLGDAIIKKLKVYGARCIPTRRSSPSPSPAAFRDRGEK